MLGICALFNPTGSRRDQERRALVLDHGKPLRIKIMCRSEPIVGTRARDKCAPAVGVSGPVFGEYAGVQFIGRMRTGQ